MLFVDMFYYNTHRTIPLLLNILLLIILLFMNEIHWN